MGASPMQSPSHMEGFTCNVSGTGVALIVPSVRLGERDLTDEHSQLQVKLELPTGAVIMQAVPMHYKPLEDQRGYVLGIRVIDMSDEDCLRFIKYLRSLH